MGFFFIWGAEMKNLLAVFMIAATGNVAAEDCALVGLMAETVMQSRQQGLGIELVAKTRLQQDMKNSAYQWPGYFGEDRQKAITKRFKREWVEACERGIYN
jgi:hypothetical protein